MQSDRPVRGRYAPPASWPHNWRCAVVVLPGVLVLLGLAGRVLLGVALVGAFVCYILDTLRQQAATLAAVWLTLMALLLGTLLTPGAVLGPTQPLALALLLVVLAGQVYFLAAVWATLQFRWVQTSHPGAALAAERVLFGLGPLVGAAAGTWGAVSAMGAGPAPFYLAALLGTNVWLMGQPLPSGFQARGAAAAAGGAALGGGARRTAPDTRVASALAAGLHCLALAVLPSVFYITVHWAALERWEHTWSLALLAAGPALLFAAAGDRLLWWLGLGRGPLRLLRAACAAAGLLAAVAGLEGRVIFHAFEHYIPVGPPWSYALVTAALYGGAGLLAAHAAGLLGPGKDPITASLRDPAAGPAAGLILLGATAAGSFAVGMPLYALPAPAMAVTGLVLFYERRSPLAYGLFALGAAGCGAWFLARHFFSLQAALGGAAMSSVAARVLAAGLLALATPGALLAGAAGPALGALLSCQTLLLGWIEDGLYAAPEEDEVVYPGYLILLTSALLVAVARRLRAAGRLPAGAAWFVQAAAAAKLAPLALPSHRPLAAALALTLAATAPHAGAGEAGFGGGEAGGSGAFKLSPRSGGPGGMLPGWQAAMHVLTMVAAILYARFTLYDALVALLGGVRPSGAQLLAAMLGLACVGAAALLARPAAQHPAWAPAARRGVLLAAAAAALMATLQPPLPGCGAHTRHAACLPWDALFDPLRRGEHGFVDDDAIYGGGEPGGGAFGAGGWRWGSASGGHHGAGGWTAWLLMGALLAALASGTSTAGGALSAAARAALALAAGGAAGLYLAVAHMAPEPGLVLVAMLAFAAAALLLSHILAPSMGSPPYLPSLFGGFLAGLPTGWLLLQPALMGAAAMGASGAARAAAARGSLMEAYAAACMLIAFAIKLRTQIGLRDARAAAGGRGGRSGGPDGDGPASHRAWGLGPERAAGLGAGLGVRTAAQEAGLEPWVPLAGNASALLCFLLALALHAPLTAGGSAGGGGGGGLASDVAILALAPILLLLSPDPYVLRGLTDRRRYLVAYAAAAAYLAAQAWLRLARGAALAAAPLGGPAPAVPYALRNGAALLLALPSHALLGRFLWDHRLHSDSLLVGLTPLNVLPLVLTDLGTVRLLAGLGLAAAGAQFWLAHAGRTAGMKYI